MRKKKGQIENIFAPVITIILIVMIVWFFINYSIAREKDIFGYAFKIESDIEADSQIISLLNQDVEIDFDEDGNNEKIQMKDLIVFSYLNEDYSIMKEEIRNYLEGIRKSELIGWNVQIFLMPDDDKLEEARVYTFNAEPLILKDSELLRFDSDMKNIPSKRIQYIKTNGQSVVHIPIFGQNEWLKIRLFEREGSYAS